MLDVELHSMFACSVFTLCARFSPELLSMCGNDNFVFNMMRMDVDCVTDVFSQGHSWYEHDSSHVIGLLCHA